MAESKLPVKSSRDGPLWSDRLARYTWRVLLVAVALGLLGGVLSAVEGPVGAPEAIGEEDRCPNPPCLNLDLDWSRLHLSDVPSVLQFSGFLLAPALGMPSLLAGAWDLLRGRPAAGGRRLLAFGGPVLVLLGAELIPHALGCVLLPWTCEVHPRYGLDIMGQWHQLDHMLVGAVPMVALYGWALSACGDPTSHGSGSGENVQRPVV